MEKVELSKWSFYLKRKSGKTMHFSEIITESFYLEKKPNIILCILLRFSIIVAKLSLKINAPLPLIFSQQPIVRTVFPA